MKKLFVLFFTICLSIYSQENNEETFRFESLKVIKNPATFPYGPIPRDFMTEKANVKQYIALGHSTELVTEATLILQTPETSEELIKFYETALQNRDWRILQKDNKGNKQVVLGESPSKRVMTILLIDEKDFRTIKIFYRRPGY